MLNIPVALILLTGIWYSFAWWSRRDLRRMRRRYESRRPSAMKVSKDLDRLLDVE